LAGLRAGVALVALAIFFVFTIFVVPPCKKNPRADEITRERGVHPNGSDYNIDKRDTTRIGEKGQIRNEEPCFIWVALEVDTTGLRPCPQRGADSNSARSPLCVLPLDDPTACTEGSPPGCPHKDMPIVPSGGSGTLPIKSRPGAAAPTPAVLPARATAGRPPEERPEDGRGGRRGARPPHPEIGNPGTGARHAPASPGTAAHPVPVSPRPPRARPWLPASGQRRRAPFRC